MQQHRSPLEAVLDDTAAMRQAMAQGPDAEDDRVELVEDAVLVEAADANGADGVEEGVPPEEPWHSGIVERKSERSAEVRLVGGTLSGLAVVCHMNIAGFDRLANGFRIKVRCDDSRDCPGALIVRQVELGPELTQQVRTRLLKVPMCSWSVGDTADWVGTLHMDSAIAETVRRAVCHDQIDGEQLVALKVDLLRSVLCQAGRLGAEHEPVAVPRMLLNERRLMQEEQTRQHAGGSEDPRIPLGERLLCHEDSTHEFKDYSTGRLFRSVDDPKGIARYVTAFLNSGQGGSLYFGITDDGYVRGNRMTQRDCDQLRTAVDAALRPVDVGGMIVGPHELEEHRHKEIRFIKVTGKGGVPLQDPSGEPVVWVVEIKVMCANGESGWHSRQDSPPTPAPKWCVRPSPSSESCLYFIKQSGSVSRHRVETLAEARRICREGYSGDFETESDEDVDTPAAAAPVEPPPGKYFGEVTAWKGDRFFGFIKPQTGGLEVFSKSAQEWLEAEVISANDGLVTVQYSKGGQATQKVLAIDSVDLRRLARPAASDVFCHGSAIVTASDSPRLSPGQRVLYGLGTDPNGRACAVDVTNPDGSPIE